MGASLFLAKAKRIFLKAVEDVPYRLYVIYSAVEVVGEDNDGGCILRIAVEDGVVAVPPAIVINEVVPIGLFHEAPAVTVVAHAGVLEASGRVSLFHHILR